MSKHTVNEIVLFVVGLVFIGIAMFQNIHIATMAMTGLALILMAIGCERMAR